MQRSPLWSFLMLIVSLIVIYYVGIGIWTFFKWAAPVLIILAAIIDHTAITRHAMWLLNKIKTTPLNGILWAVLHVVCFPLLAGYLFISAIMSRSIRKMGDKFQEEIKRQQGAFVDYTEVTEEAEVEIQDAPRTQSHNRPEMPDQFIKITKDKQEAKANPYDRLFEGDK